MFFAINTTPIESHLSEIEASVVAIRVATNTLRLQKEAASIATATAAITDWIGAKVPWLHGTEIINMENLMSAQFELPFPICTAIT